MSLANGLQPMLESPLGDLLPETKTCALVKTQNFEVIRLVMATEKRCRITMTGIADDADSDSRCAAQIAKSFDIRLDAIARERNRLWHTECDVCRFSEVR